MNRVKNLSLFLIFVLFIIQPAHGQKLLKQIQERAKNKVEQQIEKKAEEQAEKELDKAMQSTNDSLSKAKEGMEVQNIMKGLGLSGEPVPVADEYHFNHMIQMHFESFDKNGSKKDEGEFITHFSPDSKSMAYEGMSNESDEKGLFIIDSENGAIIILNDDGNQKNGIVYGMSGYFASMGESFDEEELDLSETPDTYLANPNVRKTGRTKNIAGYTCEEYVYKDEYTESNIWITKDLKLNTKDFFSTLFKTSVYSHGMGWGYMMEAISVDLESGDKSVLQVTKVDPSSNIIFNLDDYEITNLGSFQPAEEKE